MSAQQERFADFDAAFAERDAARGHGENPVRIRLYGRMWDLGSTMPAAAALRLGRLAADDDVQRLDLTDPRVVGEVIALGADLIPAPVLAAWQAKGIDIDQLGEIVLWTFEQHLSREARRKGGGKAPKKGAKKGAKGSGSSSTGGRSSKRTSSGSTASTSATPTS